MLEQALGVAVAGGPGSTFALVDGRPTQGHRARGASTVTPHARPEARAWVRGSGARCGGRLDRAPSREEGGAVLVEASDAGAPSLFVAHRYRAVWYGEGRARPARPVGDPLVLGQGAPLL